MNGKIKNFAKIGDSQVEMLQMLWEQDNLEWTYERGPGNGTAARVLDSLSKYDAIVDIPVGEGDEMEQGRVARTDNGFQWEVLEDVEGEDNSEEPESIDAPETEPEVVVAEPIPAEPAPTETVEDRMETAKNWKLDRDAEIVSLTEKLKQANESVETLRYLVKRRDEIIKESIKLLRMIDTSG